MGVTRILEIADQMNEVSDVHLGVSTCLENESDDKKKSLRN